MLKTNYSNFIFINNSPFRTSTRNKKRSTFLNFQEENRNLKNNISPEFFVSFLVRFLKESLSFYYFYFRLKTRFSCSFYPNLPQKCLKNQIKIKEYEE